MNEAIWSMFMDDNMWAVFCLSEERRKVQDHLVNHQMIKTSTIIETVQARLQDFTYVAADFKWISLRKNWKTESWNNTTLLELPTGNLLRTDVHVFSDSVLCGKQRHFKRSMGDKAL